MQLGKATLIETPKIDPGTYVFEWQETGEIKEGQYGPSFMLKYRAIKQLGDDGLEDLDYQPDHYEFFNLKDKYTKGSKEFNIIAAHLGHEPGEGEELDDSIFSERPKIKGVIEHVKNKQTGKIQAKIVSWSKYSSKEKATALAGNVTKATATKKSPDLFDEEDVPV